MKIQEAQGVNVENETRRISAAEAEEIVRAIQYGHADAIVRFGRSGHKVFTLEGAEHIYRVMVESMGEGALTIGNKGVILYANRRFAKMLKRDLAHVIGANIQDFIAPGSLTSIMEGLKTAKKRAYEATIDLAKPDGSRLPTRITMRSAKSDGRSTIVAVASDLSDIIRAAAARDQLARLVDSAMDAIVGADLNLTITSWNKGAEVLYGYSAAEVVGKSVNMLAPPERKDEAKMLMANIVAGGTVERYETERVSKSGERLDVLVTYSPILDDDGRVVGVSGIKRDITEQKRLERLQNNFVSNVSHELRTPLTSIFGALALLSQGAMGEFESRAANLIEIAYHNTKRLSRLVDDILDAEKLRSGRMVFDCKVIDLGTEVLTSIRAIQPLAAAQHIRLETELAQTAVKVDADPERLDQAITNLLSNAIKFSPEGDRVLVRIRAWGSTARLSISDHGPGIPDDFRKRLFERFAQAEGSSRKARPGTGLGLHITREIVRHMGGKISFESVVGQGSTFHIDLPIHRGPHSPTAARHHPASDVPEPAAIPVER